MDRDAVNEVWQYFFTLTFAQWTGVQCWCWSQTVLMAISTTNNSFTTSQNIWVISQLCFLSRTCQITDNTRDSKTSSSVILIIHHTQIWSVYQYSNWYKISHIYYYIDFTSNSFKRTNFTNRSLYCVWREKRKSMYEK